MSEPREAEIFLPWKQKIDSYPKSFKFSSSSAWSLASLFVCVFNWAFSFSHAKVFIEI
jgi:hypothetical protein